MSERSVMYFDRGGTILKVLQTCEVASDRSFGQLPPRRGVQESTGDPQPINRRSRSRVETELRLQVTVKFKALSYTAFVLIKSYYKYK